MRLLLDTHAFLWWLADDASLSATAEAAIADPANASHVSAATAWEINTKWRLGKLPGAALVAADVAREKIAAEGFAELPVTVAHGQHAGTLPGTHKDPFDRMLVAQALLEGMTLVSNEKALDPLGATRLR
jgi:PIN domain nuclease of toxin-antitoxin system